MGWGVMRGMTACSSGRVGIETSQLKLGSLTLILTLSRLEYFLIQWTTGNPETGVTPLTYFTMFNLPLIVVLPHFLHRN